MFRIGTVNIDTSHAPSFAEILLKGTDARYTAIYNDGFRTDEEVNAFIEKFGLEKRYTDLDEMAKNIDIAFIQSCNWDRHIELAMPFISAGVPVFIDKPIVGNVTDINRLLALVKSGAVILGTSALRYTYEHDSYFAIDESARGDIVHVSTMVGVDEFNYAIHSIESILGFLRGARPVSVRFLGTATVSGTPAESFYVTFDNGATACYHVCMKGWQPSTALVLTTKTSYAYKIDTNKVYEAMLKRVVMWLKGDKEAASLASPDEMCDAVKIMLAGKKSRETNETQLICDLSEKDVGFDGNAFEEFYAASQKK